jgi:hypothetical protein
MSAESDDLAYLRYAWGDVYCVEHQQLWTARALWGDGHTLAADTADELLGKIRRDYPGFPQPGGALRHRPSRQVKHDRPYGVPYA